MSDKNDRDQMRAFYKVVGIGLILLAVILMILMYLINTASPTLYGGSWLLLQIFFS